MQYIQNLVLDVSTEKKYQYVHAKQGDNASRYLKIVLTGGGKQITPDAGDTAVFRCLKPDGTSCVNSGTINSDGTITVELTAQALACQGTTKADVSIVRGDGILSTATFLIQVDAEPTSDDNTPSENEFLLLMEKIEEASQATANANAAAEAALAASEATVKSVNGENGVIKLPVSGTGTCNTDAATAEKQVTPTSTDFVPVEGAILAVDFAVQNTASEPMLTYGGTTSPIVDMEKHRIPSDKLTSGMHLMMRRGNTWVLLDYASKDYAGNLPGAGFDNTYKSADLTARFAGEIAAAGGDEWAWVKARKDADNFSGIHVGDYIPVMVNGHTYKAVILGINTYCGYGDVEVGPHIDWMFEDTFGTRQKINPVAYNNGLIPMENVTSNGTSRLYTLTKQMNVVSSITLNGQTLTGWTYNSETFQISFSPAPAAGTMVVTGTGTEYPWLACDAYHFVNSLAGQVPNGTGLNPAVKHVDYTQGGVYYYLPQKLKNVIVQKQMWISKRYSTSGILSRSNSAGWADIGYLWFPTECEVYGCSVWGGIWETCGSAVQYPYFAGNMNRAKRSNGKRRNWWLLHPADNSSATWCSVDANCNAKNHSVTNDGVDVAICFRT